MTYEDVPELFRAMWATYETLRRFGFTDDDIVYTASPVIQLGSKVFVNVVLKAQDKEFCVVVGALDREIADVNREWTEFREAVRDNVVPDDVLRRIWTESKYADEDYFSSFARAILEAGFLFPKLAN